MVTVKKGKGRTLRVPVGADQPVAVCFSATARWFDLYGKAFGHALDVEYTLVLTTAKPRSMVGVYEWRQHNWAVCKNAYCTICACSIQAKTSAGDWGDEVSIPSAVVKAFTGTYKMPPRGYAWVEEA